MLSNNGTNSNIVEIQQLQQQNNSVPSSEDLLKQKIELLSKKVDSLQKQGRLDRGIFRLGAIGFISYLVATNWSAIAPATAGTATAAAAPIIGIVLGSIVGVIALVCASYAIWKYRAQIKEGFKDAAKKTVDGAKDLYKTAKGGAVHAKDKVGEGVDSLKKRFKERDRVVFYNHAKEGAAIEKMTKFSEKDRKKAGEIKHELKAIFADKGDNSKLVKNILSGISLKIDLKIAEEAKSESREHTPKWQVQKDFIKHLGEKDLRVLIKQKALPSDVYFIDSVFSEHYDEIKEVIAKCKEDHILKGSPFKSGKKSGKTSEAEYQALESGTLSGKIENNPLYVAPPKLPRGNSLNSSQDFATVDPNRLRRSSSSSSLIDDSPRFTPVDPPKVPGSPSIDSGMGSGSSTPKGQSFLKEELNRKFDEIMKEFPVSQQPSTKVDVVDQQFTQVKQPLETSV